MIKSNVLIIGSGISGLSIALKIAQINSQLQIHIITKSVANESNTRWAQGGIASVLKNSKDSVNKHYQDTLIAGAGLCNKSVVKSVISDGDERIKELIEWEIKFDKNPNGQFNLGREGGHSTNRILHHGDKTGLEIETKLLRKIKQFKNIHLLEHHFTIELITNKKNECIGAYVLNTKSNSIFPVIANFTCLATGGIGQLFEYSTNPRIATGDGIAIAKKKNCIIKNMEFVQYHPTGLYNKNGTSTFLISEAVRGFGAKLRNAKGELFMQKYDSRLELAPRDIVSRAIYSECRNNKYNFVLLDCTAIAKKEFIKHFPQIHEECTKRNIFPNKDYIPVIPSAHYSCGGIAVDKKGKSSLKNLFACGECSYTGLHGANRLASNSLLEALVYAHRIAYSIGKLKIKPIEFLDKEKYKFLLLNTKKNKELKTIKLKLQNAMSKYFGITVTTKGLSFLKKELRILNKQIDNYFPKNEICAELLEVKNMLITSLIIVDQALKRKENKGTFYNTDLAKSKSKI